MSETPDVSRLGMATLAGFTASIVGFAVWIPSLRTLWGVSQWMQIYQIGMAAAGAVALIVALSTLRRHTVRRLTGIAVVVVATLLAARFTPGPYAPVTRLAEQCHLAQYGLLSLLWAWVMRRRFRDGSLYGVGLLFCAAIGLLDELVQWWIPDRVGSLADVGIDVTAGVLGQLLAALVLFAGSRRIWPASSGMAVVLRWAAVLALGVGVFVHIVHLGQRVTLPQAAVSFRAPLPAARLLARDAVWRPRPPATNMLTRLWYGEDFHLSQARYHVQARNQWIRAGQLGRAAQHQVILEKFYSRCLTADPVLMLTTAMRADLERALEGIGAAPYDAGPFDLSIRLDPLTWWLAVLACCSGLLLAAELLALGRTAAETGE